MIPILTIALGLLLKALTSFAFAIPAGMGLCIGFTAVKNWFAKRKAKRLNAKVDEELLAAAANQEA